MSLAQLQAQFEAEIGVMAAQGNRAGEAELRSQLGLLCSQHRQWERAATQFDQAAVLAEADNQTALVAQYRYAQGMSLQNLPKRRREAKRVLRRARSLFEQLKQPEFVSRVQQQTAVLHLRNGELPTAIKEINAAIAIDDSPDLLYHRAVFRWLNADKKGALADLKTAESASNDKTLQERIRFLRAGINGAAQPSDGALETLLEQTLRTVTVDDHPLHRAFTALANGRYANALKLATQARQNALNLDGPERYIHYLNACLLVALAHEKRRDDHLVLDTLLTAKGTLQRHLGKQVGQQMKMLLDALLPRWGEARFEKALAKFRQQNN